MSIKTIKLWACTDKVGSDVEREIEVDQEDWDSMNELERADYMLECFWDECMIEWGYQVVDEEA